MSQEQQVLTHMKHHGTITPLQAMNLYGCMRLAARVHDLKCKGHSIEVIKWRTSSGKDVAKYRLA
jgi:hypothetical protein